jgi:hypothetical protein
MNLSEIVIFIAAIAFALMGCVSIALSRRLKCLTLNPFFQLVLEAQPQPRAPARGQMAC